ncbi:hypothetical protein BV372_24285, partial [Nostoc sp. T09]
RVVRQSDLGGSPQEELPKGSPGLKSHCVTEDSCVVRQCGLGGFPHEQLPKGFPTPVRTTGGTPASGWLDLSKLSVGVPPVDASGVELALSGGHLRSDFVTKDTELMTNNK